MDHRAVLTDVLGAQCQQLLHAHPAAQKRADAVAEQIVRQRPYQSGDFPFRERVLFLMLSAKAVLLAAHGLGLARRIAENQSVAVSGIEDLDEHGAAFADHRKRVAVGTQLVQKTVDVDGKDLCERLLPKAFFQRLERVLIAGIGRGLHLALVVAVPGVCPVGKAHLLVDVRTGVHVGSVCAELIEHLGACLGCETDDVPLPFRRVAVHNFSAPAAAFCFADAALTV